jgi:hypothetical protein
MGRARAHTHDTTADAFAAVFGQKRGAANALARERDFAALNISALLTGDLSAIANAYFAHRHALEEELAPLREHLQKAVSLTNVEDWWGTAMPKALKTLGLGDTGTASPWLLLEEQLISERLGLSVPKRIHITDFNPIGACATALNGNAAAVALCGTRPKIAFREVRRGSWRHPSVVKARRCETCLTLAGELTIPALDERDHCTVRSSELTALALALVEQAVEHALSMDTASYKSVWAQGSACARSSLLEHLRDVVSHDPIPAVMNVLTRDERTDLAQLANLHTHLSTFDWRAILDNLLPPDDVHAVMQRRSLHDALLTAVIELLHVQNLR